MHQVHSPQGKLPPLEVQVIDEHEVAEVLTMWFAVDEMLDMICLRFSEGRGLKG